LGSGISTSQWSLSSWLSGLRGEQFCEAPKGQPEAMVLLPFGLDCVRILYVEQIGFDQFHDEGLCRKDCDRRIKRRNPLPSRLVVNCQRVAPVLCDCDGGTLSDAQACLRPLDFPTVGWQCVTLCHDM
ncbi:MAG: hypothetical protein ACK5XN_38375, partial [Bacteroidota bacterium]